ncbi:uncharacterized protein LOC115224769 [Octopus sinensis]|uniref:Uncharacterized protein LOC115224769 n=1 Tax=Octopus sinensis TaxID=2607531 RepID=A0A6P7TNM4_9MOLL|nr:uncharacterized protein LOC115224769 [Octopus sinensis]
MLSQIIPFRLTFVLILYTRFLLESHAVSTICQSCTCDGFPMRVNCQNRGLISVPQTIPLNVISLDLSENEITSIEEESFQNVRYLKYLWLHDNNIMNIEEGSFQNLSNLERLSLINNNIKDIKKETFQNLTNLEFLYLEKNGIKKIEKGTFQNLANLNALHLDNNEITVIGEGSFHNLPSLEILWLYNNRITDIEEGSFKSIPKLETLSLLKNKITNIKNGTFQKLANLRTLYLEYNKINKIENATFQNLANLKNLHLDNNEITVIEEGSFHNLPSLEILWLYDNKIMRIEEGSFQNVPSLKTLSLLRNDIKHIGERAFQNFPNLMILYLEQNKIKTIENGAFQNLVNLRKLHLDNNELTIIEEGTFQNLLNLDTLWLYNNRITDIEEGSFKSIPKLETLSLLNNRITNIKDGTFRKLANLRTLYLEHNKINKIEKATFQNLANLRNLHLDNNEIMSIEIGTFQNLSSLEALYLYKNKIKSIEEGAFQNLGKLTMLSLLHNDITYIGAGTFSTLSNLRTLNMSNNQIQGYEDGAFLFLSSLTNIDLRHNDNMACGCHLPAFVDYMKQEYSRYMNVYGSCLNDQNRSTNILHYSQCENYKLFQQNLQCQTCSTNKCTDSDVTICPGAEPVCQNTISITGVTWKLERSCSTYRKCVEAMGKNALTCKTWSSGTSCVNCCTGKLCNKRGFYGWHNILEFHLIYSMTSGSQNRPLNENISRSLEHEFLSMTGVFKVEYCGMQSNKEIFTIYCAVQNKIKDQVEQNIRDILNTSQTLHNLGLDQHNTEIIGERSTICNEDTIFTDNISFNWPMTKVGTSVTIPCHANIATRYCSYSTALHLGIPTSHSNTTQKCKPFTGVWQKPKMSLCNNTEWITQKLKDIDRQDINEGNIEKFSRQLRNISEKSLYFKEEDFNLAVDIHEKMVPLISRVSTNITLNNILLSINNMEDTPERILNGAEQAGRSVTRMLDIIETIPDQISLEEQQVTVLYSNLGIGVIKVENDTFNGSSFGVLPGNPETKAKTLIYNSSQPEDTMKIFISLPRSLFQHLKSEEQSSISRISFFFIEDDKLYKVIQTSSTKEYNKSTSHIISANIPNIQITNLNEPVTVSFNSVYQNQQCAYWDESSDQKPRWSTNGCKTSTYVPGEKVVCSCNHLTSFTLLAVAALLHYSLTATVMWMGIEAFHDYTDYKNLELNEKYFMIVSSILAWGLPAVITLAVNYTNNYISVAQVCWLSKTSFYITFLTPVLIVCIFQIIFSFHTQKHKHGKEDYRTNFCSFICLFYLLFLFRLLWLLAFLAFYDSVELFDKLFGIFNILQSLLIFIFYCIDYKYIRNLICNREEDHQRHPSLRLQNVDQLYHYVRNDPHMRDGNEAPVDPHMRDGNEAPVDPHMRDGNEAPVDPHMRDGNEAPVDPHMRDGNEAPVDPHMRDGNEAPVDPHMRDGNEAPVDPHMRDGNEAPVDPHMRDGNEAPVDPHMRDGNEAPVDPHMRDGNEAPVGLNPNEQLSTPVQCTSITHGLNPNELLSTPVQCTSITHGIYLGIAPDTLTNIDQDNDNTRVKQSFQMLESGHRSCEC